MEKRVDLTLLLLYAKGSSGKLCEPITGITRLTKLIFLLEIETGVSNDFNFVAYKVGQYTNELNPVIEFLTTFPTPSSPLLNADGGTAIYEGVNPEQSKYVSDLVSPDDSAQQIAKEVNKTFTLTKKGELVAEQIWNGQTDKTQRALEFIKTKYGRLPLKDLLRYVYTKYPDMTEKSEIKDWVFGQEK